MFRGWVGLLEIQVLNRHSARPVLRCMAVAAALAAITCPLPALADVSCQHATAQIPPSPAGALDGHTFAQRVMHLEGAARDSEVRAELLAGNLPDSLRHLTPVTLTGRSDSGAPVQVTFCVMPDYLAVGSDRDALLVPMGLPTALEIADAFGFALPTPRLVDAIYAAAPVKLAPEPLPASNAMRGTPYLIEHDALIVEQRTSTSAPAGVLTAGHKKDLVLSDRLLAIPGRVAIYGWHTDARHPIQPLSTVHGAQYADYSHGVRLISRIVYVNGTPRAFFDVLKDPALHILLGADGALVARQLQGLWSVLQQRNPK